jgi:endonuclease III
MRCVIVSGIEEELSKLPTYSYELGLDLSKPADRFKWFLASLLFAKRISAETVKKTFRRFADEELNIPEDIIEAGWDRLVEILDSGSYVRYDFSTATNLLETMKKLKTEYGNLVELHRRSSNPRDLEKRLEEFKGFGPVGVNIFLRELRGIWPKAEPEPSKIAVETARSLNLDKVKEYEFSLVRLRLEHCRKRRCSECPVHEYCQET